MKTKRRIKISFTTREILASPSDMPEIQEPGAKYHHCPLCHSPLVEGEGPAISLLLEAAETELIPTGTYSNLEKAINSEGD